MDNPNLTEIATTPNVPHPDSTTPTRALIRFFVSPDELLKVETTAYYQEATGMVESCLEGNRTLDLDGFVRIVHAFEFSNVCWDRLNFYRQQTAIYPEGAKSPVINQVQLRGILWTWHLKGWNYTDASGNPIPLTFDPNGALSNDSLKLLYQIPNIILDTTISQFERRVGISSEA